MDFRLCPQEVILVAQPTFEEPPLDDVEKREWTVTRKEARRLRSQLRSVRPLVEESQEGWIPSAEEAAEARRSLRRASGDPENQSQRRTLAGAILLAAVLHFVAGPMLLPGLYSERDVLQRMSTHTLPVAVQVAVWMPPTEASPAPVVTAEKVAPVQKVVQEAKPAKPAATTRRRVAKKAKPTPKPAVKTVVAGNAAVTPVIASRASAVEVAGSGETLGPEDASGEVAGNSGPVVDLDALFTTYVSRVGRDVHRDFRYPRSLIRAGVEGTVIIEIIVDGLGRIQDYKIAKSSGNRQLDKAALKAMKSVGEVSAPPAGLGWVQRAIQVPFVYQLKRSV